MKLMMLDSCKAYFTVTAIQLFSRTASVYRWSSSRNAIYW